ncbi:MAG: glycerol-3-phosphate 1-O-acyltransferase PlsY [Chloroflexi bacterium]|jgi:glycerol-3-phosphate acyltransferase PlsY|nr:glycerol-3-phosphate 1-O-acyltransferase PlsY [Chloroflexota bacterium]MBT5628541.1 glycerol-3-phosphate 1-O-acyltransferase PlsY [Chloroflexota bacterium]
MSDPVTAILVLALAYFVGAIPFGVIIGRIFRGVDIRSYGSGGSGATNVNRTLGPWAGGGVLAADVGKGLVVTALARYVFDGDGWLIAAAGTIAVLGHMFPVYIRFKGGKGVATGLGALAIISPIAAAIALSGVVIAAITRYVSLGSIIGSSVSLGLLFIFSVFEMSVFGMDHELAYLLFAVPVPIFIIWSHRKNVDRLAKGDESKLDNKPAPRRAQRTP